MFLNGWTIELFLIFSLNSLNSVTKKYLYLKGIFKTAISCVREKGVTIGPIRHVKDRIFKFLFHFEKTPMRYLSQCIFINLMKADCFSILSKKFGWYSPTFFADSISFIAWTTHILECRHNETDNYGLTTCICFINLETGISSPRIMKSCKKGIFLS